MTTFHEPDSSGCLASPLLLFSFLLFACLLLADIPGPVPATAASPHQLRSSVKFSTPLRSGAINGGGSKHPWALKQW